MGRHEMSTMYNNKQLLDECLYGIIKVSSVLSALITLIILDHKNYR